MVEIVYSSGAHERKLHVGVGVNATWIMGVWGYSGARDQGYGCQYHLEHGVGVNVCMPIQPGTRVWDLEWG